ncbi:GTPase family protein [Aeromicrobium sp. 50.2.37]|uniref:GTPase family protein n=1 Tax=Aeromicrobium sp. 50.2.37 TaxID=2969305 RepID=UPI00214F683C|nr:GTPase [Aeromicrobium sp. 50.2.37]MCR4514558.1 50S ribosome-binding GTPase [Aeromicrobium sp. 50.2.37]
MTERPGPVARVAEKVFGGERSDVATRLDGLSEAVEAARDRLADDVLDPAAALAERASDRLRLSGEHTIVALAGATGSGKSSLFNCLTDLELAGVGVRRPTTSWALACSWGPDGAQELLEWMGIPARHQVSRMSMLDHSSADTKLDGLVLLDLPDHDSTEVSHHLEMDRLVQYADLLVWVLDPQKYADAAIHDRYIRPMAGYSDVTLVVLNQIDRIHYSDRERALGDVRAILEREGLPDVPVIGVSAHRGDGVDDLKRELARRIRAKASAKDRLAQDVAEAAERVVATGGRADIPGITDIDRQALDLALLDSVGAPQLVEAVEASTLRTARRHTGWPPLRWVGRLRKDPLRELGIDPTGSVASLTRAVRPSIGHVQRAQAESAVRETAEKAAVGLERPWRDAVRDASVRTGDDVVRELDDTVDRIDLGLSRTPVWWRLVDVLQWLAFVAFVAGVGWGAVELASRVAGWEVPDAPVVLGFSLPLLLLVGGLAAGVVLAVLARVAVRASARRRAQQAEAALRRTVDEVARDTVLAPLQAELDRYERYRSGIVRALG